MNKTPQTLKGFRDFLPQEKRTRDYIANKLVTVFQNFGFEPLETPTLEYADLLLGKYGVEADKLVYTFEDKGKRNVGLRYDQTVPLSRVLGQYQNQLPKYFRRYQIQNVFRADKPQKGRYREFTQCDLDIVGSTDTIADAEILATTYFAFKAINYPTIKIKINDRVALIDALKPYATDQVDVYSIIQTIDKLDKLSSQEVVSELNNKGLSESQKVLDTLNSLDISPNLEQIIKSSQDLGIPKSAIDFEPSLARGLDYYTGMIFEMSVPEYTVGSLGGGGRYDNLVGELSGYQTPAVGVGFGFDRMVEAAQQFNLIPNTNMGTQVLVTLFDSSTRSTSLQVTNQLRQSGIKTEVFPSQDKLGKQLKLANQRQIPYVIVIGEQEASQNQVSLKNMQTGDQQTLSIEEAIKHIQSS